MINKLPKIIASCFLFLALLFLLPEEIKAQFCKFSPTGNSLPEYPNCVDYTMPGADVLEIGSGGSQCQNPNPPNLQNNQTYTVCCQTERDTCSVYNVRQPLCGSSDTGIERVKCEYSVDSRVPEEDWLLMCYGNNYRNCATDSDFPPSDEGGPGTPRTGFLGVPDDIGDWVTDPDAAGKYDSIKYNGVNYDEIPNGRVCFCDQALEGGCICPGIKKIEGRGESRLWFPSLRIITTISSALQSLFAPSPSRLLQNTAPSNRQPKLTNPNVATTRIEKHQGIDDDTPVLDEANNNSSLVTGKEAPPPLYKFDGGENIYSKNAQCVIPEVINNPGDDLLGPNIEARVLYTQKYTYTACPSINCVGDGQIAPAAEGCCSYNPGSSNCHAAGEAVAGGYKCGVLNPASTDTKGKVTVFVKNPLIEQIWDTLVNGQNSLFKQFAPLAKIQKIEEIPSSVAYQASAVSENAEGAAANLKIGEHGAPYPVFYVPHVGSLGKYWLTDLQNALRPQALASRGPGGVGPSPSTPPGAMCSIANSGIASPELLKLIAEAASWARIPVEVLIAVVRNEAGCISNPGDSGRLCNLQNISEFLTEGTEFPINCPGGGADADADTRAKGPLQFFHSLSDQQGRAVQWGLFRNAVNQATGENRVTNICNVKDSVYAAAYELSWTSSSCPSPGGSYNVGQTKDPSSWTLEDMQTSLSRWAVGCQPVCQYPDSTADDYYCDVISGYIDPNNPSFIDTDCN